MLKVRKSLSRIVTTCVAILAVAPTVAAYAGSGAEKLRANPTSVMVNGNTTLTGTGFPAHKKVSLEECGVTFWIVPKEPCDTENRKTIETNARGGFIASFKVQLCPEGKPGVMPTERICYIGVPRFGEDTVTLEPVVEMRVSYP